MSEQRVRIENIKDSLLIRSATLEDASILTKWWNDGTVMAHAGFPNGLNQSIEQTKEQIRNNDLRLSQQCIIEMEDKRIGEIFFGIGQEFAEIGIKICEIEYQNKGLGTKLIHMLIDFLFEDTNINNKVRIKKIILDTNLKNIRAQHVYEKIGFTKVSVNYNSWKDQLGILQSSVNYELTREQYEEGARRGSDNEVNREKCY